MSADQSLEELPGIGPATAERLHDEGFKSFKAIAAAQPRELSDLEGIGESTAETVVSEARNKADIGTFRSAKTVKQRRNKLSNITTGVDSFDAILGGGIPTGSLTEIYAKHGVGKTQIAHQVSVTAQLPAEHGGVKGKTIYIDTEDTFRPNRIEGMVKGLSDEHIEALADVHGVPSDDIANLADAVLDNIMIAKAYGSNHQVVLAEKANEIVNEEQDNEMQVKLVIVDSLTAHFRAEYVGRGNLAERQQKLNKHLADLHRLTDMYDLAILYTNQVASNPDSFFGDPTDPIGGNILGHNSTVRVYLKQAKKNKRTARIKDSPDLPEHEALLSVKETGVKSED